MADRTDLIAAIYDAVIDPSDWDNVIGRIVRATGSVGGVIGIHQVDRSARRIISARVPATFNIDPYYANAFAQTYHKINPLDAAVLLAVPGKVVAASYITQTDSFRASTFYNEFLRPQGQADSVGIGLFRTSTATGYLALARSPGAICIEPAEWHLLESLAPHLQRAAALHQLLAWSNATSDSLGAAVAAAGFGVFLLTGDCRVIRANAKAEDLVRLGISLRYEQGRLTAANPALTARLNRLVHQGVLSANAEGDVGGTLELRGGDDRAPLLAHVIPLAANRAVSIFDIDQPAAAVFIVDPAADFGARVRRFASRFRLTPGETRVVAVIIGGEGLQAATERLKISRATVRTHLDRIFSKTETNRQTELIRRFFEMSSPGPPPSV